MFDRYTFTVLDRFLRYVRIDTQSDPDSKTFPSTEKQKDLGRILVKELLEMGISDAALDEHGYVYATLPANTARPAPVICFCSHMDTSPDSSGKDVKPIVHRGYDGKDLVLPDDPGVVIRLAEHPDLADQMGNDIVTASGTTLLGADNKAGVAEIMDMVHFFMKNPQYEHGKIRILFTPDEEVGRGVEKVDLGKLGADFGYTVDGEKRGSLENETFSADAMTVIFRGKSAHPGFAKGKMESAIKAAAAFLASLPADRLSPESTTGRDGFVHPLQVSGTIEETKVVFIIRDFDTENLKRYEAEVRALAEKAVAGFPHSRVDIVITEQYRNMKEVLDRYPEVVENARKAIERAGLSPTLSSIRGGTDGSRLSFMGLPCPNIFAGEHAFHSREEWVSVRDMEKAVETLVHLAMIWAGK
jgi:tripeptide aminopeptidase